MANTNDTEDINNSYYNDYKDDGYELVLVLSNNDDYKYGIFCKNYEKITMVEKDDSIDFDKLIKNINVNEIIDKIVGQDDAINTIVSNTYANQLIINTNNPDLIQTEKVSILVDGPTGTRKTAIMKEIAKEYIKDFIKDAKKEIEKELKDLNKEKILKKQKIKQLMNSK